MMKKYTLIAYNLKEACELVEIGFEYVTDINGCKNLPQARVDKFIEK